MGIVIASVFGVLVIVFIYLSIVDASWDKWIRPHLFKDKIDHKFEDAKEEYIEHQVDERLNQTFRSNHEPISKKDD